MMTVFISADVDDASSLYCIQDEIFYKQLRQFRTAISEDIAHLNGAEVGTKGVNNFVEWEMNGKFQRIMPDTFVYLHSIHANCSSVKYSQLMDICFPECTTHLHHDTLEPFLEQ